jgi:ParB/RepB/Spo0J family partition protein
MALQVKKPSRKPSPRPAGDEEQKPKSELYKRVHQNGDILDIPVGDIDPNPFNEREMVGLDEMAESIAEVGLINPITILRRETFAQAHPGAAEGLTKKWILGPGEHRWRATMLAGKPTIRAILRNDLARQVRSILLLENAHRADPTPIELARQVHKAMTEDGLSIREAAKILKMGATSVHKLTELLKLPDEVSDSVHRRDLLPTHARKLLKLDDPDDVVAAWRLMCASRENPDEPDLKPEDAVRLVLARQQLTVPPENSEERPAETTEDQGSEQEPPPPEDPPVPKPREKATEPKPEPRFQWKKEKSPYRTVDPQAAERDTAAADRDAGCCSFLEGDDIGTPEQVSEVISRALLVPVQQAAARARAHAWLSKAGTSGLNMSNSDAYHEAVLASGNTTLIARVTFAIALAAGEIRAADRRRRTWDRHDAAHIRFLIEVARYMPETEWERRELTKFGVPVPDREPTEF